MLSGSTEISSQLVVRIKSSVIHLRCYEGQFEWQPLALNSLFGQQGKNVPFQLNFTLPENSPKRIQQNFKFDFVNEINFKTKNWCSQHEFVVSFHHDYFTKIIFLLSFCCHKAILEYFFSHSGGYCKHIVELDSILFNIQFTQAKFIKSWKNGRISKTLV